MPRWPKDHVTKKTCPTCGGGKDFYAKQCRRCEGSFISGSADYLERFWGRVGKSTSEGCWLWSGARDRQGYGFATPRCNSGKTSMRAHRVSWVISRRCDIPEGMHILHRCDNPPCVNPDHLRLGTHLENMADMTRKRRYRVNPGEESPLSKVTEADVIAMREDVAEGVTQAEVSRRYNLSQSHVSRIIKGLAWSHVASPSEE